MLEVTVISWASELETELGPGSLEELGSLWARDPETQMENGSEIELWMTRQLLVTECLQRLHKNLPWCIPHRSHIELPV